ncbi:glycerol kinase [Novosphingobium sp. FSY-8]|uniref:ATP:glycerol 3-phosphotransferase n=1 Tax=Novosphingobium ovatum TaxID=1908523 RepID=A0ABW9XBA7_9SPHN|nr:FGGY family carbohydrate kinase [Novosphingobium ovatum]NBC35819.1 glycerol kinase [Novosphingobium ovatum]
MATPAVTVPAILTIDQGTTNTKALIVALDGVILSSGSVPTGVSHPRPGWAESDATAIRDSVAAAIRAATSAAPQADIRAIGISNQRETVVAWDARDGAPIAPAPIWQCRRSAPLCATLQADGHAARIETLSGLGLDPLFSAGKLRWLIDHVTGAGDLLAAGHLRAGTIDSWLLWHLTGGASHATDTSNAARTQLCDLDRGEWSDELCALFGVPRAILPQIRASDALFGDTAGGFAGLPDGIPIHAMMGDSHAALFGHAITAPGRVKVTLGTGSSLMCPTATRAHSTHGLSGTVAWRQGNATTYALEGNITVSGHAAAFGARMLGLSGPEALSDLAMSVADSDGVVFVPALAGLGAPHWDADARGMLCGLSLGSTPAHIARAILEAIAHQIGDVVAAIEADLGHPIAAICVDGSAARNDALMQMLADVTGRVVERPSQTELSALGAAMMAAQGCGQPIAASAVAKERVFSPALPDAARQAARTQWAQAIARARR